jgi:hypothetical protein
MKTRITASLVVLLGCLLISTPDLRAELIDFESGFARLDPVTTIATPTNVLTIVARDQEDFVPFIAQVGTTPKDAFEKVVDGNIFGDTPAGGNPGSFFLTTGAGNLGNYLFNLEYPVDHFSVDLYDYVGDGGAAPTDFVELRAFSDAARTEMVASSTHVVPRPRPEDGAVVTMSVTAESIAALTLQFSTFDRGTGVDNIQFVTVPEPVGLGLMVMSVLMLLAWGRGSRRAR